MSDPVFCPWCDLQHPRNAPCPPATIDPGLIMRTPMPAAVHPRAPPPTHPNLPVPAPAAAATPAPTTTTTTGTSTAQPASKQQMAPQAGPSHSRFQKRKEAPSAPLHRSISDHESETQRELRREWYKADMNRRLAKKPRGQEEEEEQAVQDEEEEEGQRGGEEREGIEKGVEKEKGAGPNSVIAQRLVRAVGAWKARAMRLEAEKEALRAALEEERERNEEVEMWRRNTLEPF